MVESVLLRFLELTGLQGCRKLGLPESDHAHWRIVLEDIGGGVEVPYQQEHTAGHGLIRIRIFTRRAGGHVRGQGLEFRV